MHLVPRILDKGLSICNKDHQFRIEMMSGEHFGSSFDVDGDGDEAEGEIGSWAYRGRSASVFLIDTAKEMFVNPGKEEDGEEPPFYQAVRAAHSTMMRKVFSNDQDLSALVLFNTRETKNHIDFSHVYTLQDLECPDAERVLALEELLAMPENLFDTTYGHSTDASLQDALRVCQSVLDKWTGRLSEQNILLFTCRDDPHSGDSQKQRQARKKAQDLKEAQIELEILHMGETFNVNKFYKDLIILDVSEDNEDSQSKITLADPTSRFKELLERVRRLDHKQRTTGRVMFTLAPGVEMSVGVYTAVRKMNKPYKSKMWKETNEEVKYVKKSYLRKTGELISSDDILKYQVYGGKEISLTLDEVSKLKQVYDVGIHLLGFKPISRLKPYYHVRSAQFIYPDETLVQGSTKMFAALLERCLARKVTPIVRFIPHKGATVSWAALVPQAEKLDDKNCQVTPPGFVVSHLPFADDFRNIKLKNATRATPEQVDAAKPAFKKIFFKYSPQDFDNPDIQTHLRNIEALALNRSQLDPVIDLTIPDYENITKRAGKLLETFRDLVYPPSYDPKCITKKRPAATSSSGSKRAKPDPARIDVAAVTKAGKAHTLTVDVLKAWLQIRGISINGKRKADLVLDVIEQVDREPLTTDKA
ncbi:X-ray repair cross-complementing protein 6-like [Homarus americanus]|uniref:X-ray repair cross-complementing protein 6-like n=1 Tax=Homarus americanus TaxID=6706 RepID=UPI001C45C97D|nr:X-ray repair cross-complementing protein 6-like [Homarus americanus]